VWVVRGCVVLCCCQHARAETAHASSCPFRKPPCWAGGSLALARLPYLAGAGNDDWCYSVAIAGAAFLFAATESYKQNNKQHEEDDANSPNRPAERLGVVIYVEPSGIEPATLRGARDSIDVEHHALIK
jgi:hypothetical protein